MSDTDKHNYEYDIDLEGPSAPARVVRMVGQNKKVLEIGAGPGSITRHLVANGANDVSALELDESAIAKLRKYVSNIYPADLNSASWTQLLKSEGSFDVVIAADVLEHLYDPWSTLIQMKSLLSENGYVVLSLPHVGHSAISACLMDHDFGYQDWGLLDRTHIRFFGLKNIQALIEQAGLVIDHAEFVVVHPEATEFAQKWLGLSADLRNALSKNRFGHVYQVVLKASPRKPSSSSINLLSLGVAEISLLRRLISVLRRLGARYIPEFIKAPLRRLLFPA